MKIDYDYNDFDSAADVVCGVCHSVGLDTGCWLCIISTLEETFEE